MFLLQNREEVIMLVDRYAKYLYCGDHSFLNVYVYQDMLYPPEVYNFCHK